MEKAEYFKRKCEILADLVNRLYGYAEGAKGEVQSGFRYYKSSDTLARLLFNLFDAWDSTGKKLAALREECEKPAPKPSTKDVVLTDTDEREMRRDEMAVDSSVANMVVNSRHDF